MNINRRISLLFTLLLILTISIVGANHGVFNVKCKFSGDQRSLSVLKAHDYRRQISLITGVDLPLGGTGRPDAVGSVVFQILHYSQPYFFSNYFIFYFEKFDNLLRNCV